MLPPMSKAVPSSQDRVLEVFGETVIIRRDPTGQLDAAVIEEVVPPGVGAPLHRHSREDEISYIIEGSFRIWRGEQVLDVGAGAVALLPRGQIHTFQNVGAATGRLLTIIAPAGFERFFEIVAERGLSENDDDQIAAVAAEFGLEIVGPPPSEDMASAVR